MSDIKDYLKGKATILFLAFIGGNFLATSMVFLIYGLVSGLRRANFNDPAADLIWTGAVAFGVSLILFATSWLVMRTQGKKSKKAAARDTVFVLGTPHEYLQSLVMGIFAGLVRPSANKHNMEGEAGASPSRERKPRLAV